MTHAHDAGVLRRAAARAAPRPADYLRIETGAGLRAGRPEGLAVEAGRGAGAAQGVLAAGAAVALGVAAAVAEPGQTGNVDHAGAASVAPLPAGARDALRSPCPTGAGDAARQALPRLVAAAVAVVGPAVVTAQTSRGAHIARGRAARAVLPPDPAGVIRVPLLANPTTAAQKYHQGVMMSEERVAVFIDGLFLVCDLCSLAYY